MHIADFDFALPRELIATAPVRAARCGSAAGHARVRRVRGPADRRSAGAAAAGRSARLQRHQGDPGPADRPPRRGGGRDHPLPRSRRRCVARLCERSAPAASGRPSRLRRRLRRRPSPRNIPRATSPWASISKRAAFREALARHGTMPLPPYIKRPRGGDARDRSDYQTIFARDEGAVAAPTAGLHFTPALLDALAAPRHRMDDADLACRAGHLSAGQSRRSARAPDACRMGHPDGRGGRAHRRGQGARAGASSRSGRRACASSKAPRPRPARSSPLPARPGCSSCPAIASARSTCC